MDLAENGSTAHSVGRPRRASAFMDAAVDGDEEQATEDGGGDGPA